MRRVNSHRRTSRVRLRVLVTLPGHTDFVPCAANDLSGLITVELLRYLDSHISELDEGATSRDATRLHGLPPGGACLLVRKTPESLGGQVEGFDAGYYLAAVVLTSQHLAQPI